MESSRTPTRLSAAIFRAKACGLQLRRGLRDWRDQVQRHRHVADCERGNYQVVWAESRSSLWNEVSVPEQNLQLGKVQNLRCALSQLDGAVVPAGEVFSFWKQVGQATRRRGFVEGRLLREGCLIPAVGGGLCQLSNALYDVALQADLEIVERYGHSHIVPGSVALSGRDATVAWNYIDLRFRSAQKYLIEAVLTRDELIVRLRGRDQCSRVYSDTSTKTFDERSILNPVLHSCTTCGQTACFRHLRPRRNFATKTAWLLDEAWPEYQQYVASHRADGDELLIPIDGERFKQGRYNWSTQGFAHTHTAAVPAAMRSVRSRQLAPYGTERLASQLQSTAAIAKALSRKVLFDAAHLVVAQSLLPQLWRMGVLGGRSFDVLMTHLPLRTLHARLDEEWRRCPERSTLGEFRAPCEIVEWEAQAIDAADHIITPHCNVASLFPSDRAILLPWKLPEVSSSSVTNPRSQTICFPGPVAARKGAYELREVARTLHCQIIVCGSELEGDSFWDGVEIHRVASFESALALSCAVVQPALIEDNPRRLLHAIARGIPVIATRHCGIAESEETRLVPFGNCDALSHALFNVLSSRMQPHA